MRLALLGIDDESLSLVRAATTSDAGELTVYADVAAEGALQSELFALAPAARRQSWESLLFGDVCDLVIAARGGEERIERLRKLTQQGVPLLVMHPVGAYLEAVELDMIRRDGGGLLMPYSPGARHEALAALEGPNGAEAAAGRRFQFSFTRELASADRAAVLDAFCRDALLLTQIVGRMDQVTAMGQSPEGDLSHLSVGLTTSAGHIVRWEARPAQNEPAATLLRTSDRRVLRLDMPADERLWKITRSGEPAAVTAFADFRGEADMLLHVQRALAGEAPRPNWQDACHALEIAANVEESIRRGRTIAIHTDRHSEENTFKGLMAMGGCGLMLAGLGSLLVVAVIEGIRLSTYRPEDNPSTFWDWPWYWRFAPAYPFVAFLLLQLFRLVFRSPREKREDAENS